MIEVPSGNQGGRSVEDQRETASESFASVRTSTFSNAIHK